MWIEFNPNPKNRKVDDCSVRALCAALNISWNRAYAMLCAEGNDQCDMPHSNSVWGSILRFNGFERQIVPNTCPDCYSLKEFVHDNLKGIFVIAVQDHVVTVKNGLAYDTWDSLDTIPQYFWYRKE